MEREVFLDTAYAIALSAPTDSFYPIALTVSERLETEGTRIVTTRAVLIEVGDSLAKQRFRAAATKLLDSIENDPTITILSVPDSLYFDARKLFRNRDDKEWGLTDCISFVVMKDRRLNEALTSELHFEQAGFRALLREEVS